MSKPKKSKGICQHHTVTSVNSDNSDTKLKQEIIEVKVTCPGKQGTTTLHYQKV